MESPVISGTCEPAFAAVRQAFESNFEELGEVGAAVSVTLRGKTVVDLWGGVADPESAAPWEAGTLCHLMSSTKGATAFCAHVLASRAQLDLDALVTDYWPEYGQNGKAGTTVAMLLSHQSGLCVITDPLPRGALYDWEYMVRVIERQEPHFAPGTRHGYEGHLFGWLVGELVRRIAGKPLGQFFRDEIATPLAADLWIGLPPEQEAKVSRLLAPKVDPTAIKLPSMVTAGEGTVQWHMVHNNGGWSEPDASGRMEWDSREAHAAQLGGSGGMGNARGLARMYAPLANGGALDGRRYVDQQSLARMGAVASAGTDFALLFPTRYSLGFMKSTNNLPRSEGDHAYSVFSEAAFGQAGAGGSVGLADPSAHMSFGYTMNQMKWGLLMTESAQRLVDATYGALGYGTRTPERWLP
jgi:CubicO group peptidase (beta-lactamase class C family)